MRWTLTVLLGAVVALVVSAAPAEAAVGQVRNSNSHKCLAVAGGSAVPGALAVQFTCDGSGYRLWGFDGPCSGLARMTWLVNDGPEYGVQLQSRLSGLYISPAGGS